jgi:hypothetical protein
MSGRLRLVGIHLRRRLHVHPMNSRLRRHLRVRPMSIHRLRKRSRHVRRWRIHRSSILPRRTILRGHQMVDGKSNRLAAQQWRLRREPRKVSAEQSKQKHLITRVELRNERRKRRTKTSELAGFWARMKVKIIARVVARLGNYFSISDFCREAKVRVVPAGRRDEQQRCCHQMPTGIAANDGEIN